MSDFISYTQQNSQMKPIFQPDPLVSILRLQCAERKRRPTMHVARKVTFALTLMLLIAPAGRAFADDCTTSPCVVGGTSPDPQVVGGTSPDPSVVNGAQPGTSIVIGDSSLI